VGAATATVLGEALNVEYLARNSASRAAEERPVGQTLLDAAESLAAGFRLLWVTLEALDEPGLIAYYERRGFVRAAPPLFDAAWGTLHPMKRSVSSRPP